MLSPFMTDQGWTVKTRQDNFSQWVHKIRSTSESSAVVVQLQHEVERMEAALPLLKYVGGEILSMDHWQELHRETTMKWLSFGEMLGVSDLMVQKSQDLKVRRRCPFSQLGP